MHRQRNVAFFFKFGLFIGILNIVVLSIVFSGSCVCLVKLTKCDFEAPYKEEILYGVGIVPPFGVVIAFMDVEDVKYK